jgi:hypothetical protein
VSFGIPFETCRAMGWALKDEGRKALADGASDDPSALN